MSKIAANHRDNRKKILMLQQAEKHFNLGHSLLCQTTNELRNQIVCKLEHQKHNMIHYSDDNKVNVENVLHKSKRLKLNQSMDNNNNESTFRNNSNQIIQSNQKNQNDTNIDDIKMNEAHNVSLCDEVILNNIKNIQQSIEHQNKIMERLDQLGHIQNNQMKQMEQMEQRMYEILNNIDNMMKQRINGKVEDGSQENNLKVMVGDDILVEKCDSVKPQVETNEAEVESQPNKDETIIDNTQDDCNSNDDLLRGMIKTVTSRDEINNTLPINVIKNNNGKVLFVESNVEFINLLRLLQDIPIGILSQTIQKHNPFDNLRTSLQNLPTDPFGLSKEDGLISTNMTMTDLNYLGLESVEVTLKTGGSMDCKGSGNGPYICNGRTHNKWKNGVAFCGLGRSFEIALVLPKDYPARICLGILPDDSNLFDRFATKDVSENHGFFLYPNSSGWTLPGSNKDYPEIFQSTKPKKGKELRMRFEQEPQKLEYSYDDGPWYQVEIKKGYGIEETTQCCPVLLSWWNDCPITVTKVKSLDKKKSDTHLLKSNSTFLISNELEISSTIDKTISQLSELYQKYNVYDLSTVEFCTVNFGCIELRKLITALFHGERNILSSSLS